MKRTIALIAVIVFSIAAAFAQEAKVDNYNTIREFKNKVFTVQHRDPNNLASAINLLGSGFKGAGLNINKELGTITVRDFPENLAAIEEALKRLDRPATKEPDLELKIAVLIGSKSPLSSTSVPAELASVVKELQSTLTYAHYGLMTATVHRTKTGIGIEGSGVAEATLLGMKVDQARPILYNYNLRGIKYDASGDRAAIDIDNFKFSMRVPIEVSAGSIQYQPVGFETPVSIRPGEKVLIGTTTMGDKALIVVVTASVSQ